MSFPSRLNCVNSSIRRPKLRRLNFRNRKARSTPRMKSSMPVTAFSARFRVSSRRSSRRRAANSGSPTVTCSARKVAVRWLRDCATGKASSTPSDLTVFWQGPSLGYDFGVDGARTMMLVYNLPATDAIYQRFAGIEGSAYLVGGLGMTALTMNNIRGPDPHGGGDTAWRECRLSQIHTDGDLEPVLNRTRTRGGSCVDGPRLARDHLACRTEVACSHVSGLFTQSGGTAGPDGVREPRPHHSSGIDVPMNRQAYLGCVGSADCAITRHCSLASSRTWLSGLSCRGHALVVL